MAAIDYPPGVKTEAFKLWTALTETEGEPAKVHAAMHRAMTVAGPDYFQFVVSAAMTMFFLNSWPAVLAQLASRGVAGDDVQTAIGTALAEQVADYLRADVTDKEA